ncbi:MAG TPA: pirin family protein [Anaeromyxobacteraceae bacterium]|nr:pirin family protein [Anaeromyxobacteraceae bacterium]
MITIRRSGDRGHLDHGWLDTRHTFSFGEYHDDRFMGFSDLRVVNEDRVRPGQGFGTHGHRDMEILSYVLAGELAHRDSMGNGSTIRPGEVQRMSAGTGVTHSERNPSASEPVHFLQIWILPRERGLPPGYEQRAFPAQERRGRLRVLASPDGRDGSVTIHQDATMSGTLLEKGESVAHAIAPGRVAWLQVARGEVAVNGHHLRAGDGLAAVGEPSLEISGAGDGQADVLVFDLAD